MRRLHLVQVSVKRIAIRPLHPDPMSTSCVNRPHPLLTLSHQPYRRCQGGYASRDRPRHPYLRWPSTSGGYAPPDPRQMGPSRFCREERRKRSKCTTSWGIWHHPTLQTNSNDEEPYISTCVFWSFPKQFHFLLFYFLFGIISWTYQMGWKGDYRKEDLPI